MAAEKRSKKFKDEYNIRYLKVKKINSIKELIYRGKYSKAYSEIDRYLEEYPNDSYGLFQKGSLLLELDLYEDAKEIFTKIYTEKMESYHAALYKLACIALVDGEIDKAEEYLKHNIETSNYDEAYSIIKLININLAKGKYDEAYQIICGANVIENQALLVEQAKVYNKLGDTKQALEIINTYEFDNSYLKVEQANAYLVKSEILFCLNRLDEARQNIKKAVEISKGVTYVKVLYYSALLEYFDNNYEKSLNICLSLLENKEFKEKNHLYGKIFTLIGDIYNDLDEFTLAKDYYTKSLNYNGYCDQEGYLKLSLLELKYGDYDSSKKYLENKEFISMHNVNIELLIKAVISYREGNHEQAKKLNDSIDSSYLEKEYMLEHSWLSSVLLLEEGQDLYYDTYTNRQLKEYRIDSLIKHIDKGHKLREKISYFNDNIDLEQLALEIPELLDNATLIKSIFSKKYIISYPNIGVCDGKVLNNLEMVVLPNSNNVLTMYPVDTDYFEKKEQNKILEKSKYS